MQAIPSGQSQRNAFIWVLKTRSRTGIERRSSYFLLECNQAQRFNSAWPFFRPGSEIKTFYQVTVNCKSNKSRSSHSLNYFRRSIQTRKQVITAWEAVQRVHSVSNKDGKTELRQNGRVCQRKYPNWNKQSLG